MTFSHVFVRLLYRPYVTAVLPEKLLPQRVENVTKNSCSLKGAMLDGTTSSLFTCPVGPNVGDARAAGL